MFVFVVATLLPVAFLTAAAVLGGVWVWISLAYLTVFAWLVDRLVVLARRPNQVEEFPTGTRLAALLGAVQFPMLCLAIWAIAGPTDLSLGHRLALVVAFGLFFGQIGHPTAHELIHKPSRELQSIGILTYIILLFGHHTSAHLRVHHIHVGTDKDPNSSPAGTGFWSFFRRAWIGSFLAGLKADNQLRERSKSREAKGLHPYAAYIGGALLTLMTAAVIAGGWGVVTCLVIAVYAQIQILLADYMQHYGLRRRIKPNGKPEPVGPKHSWNSPQFWSSAMMLNASRHSHHHIKPSVPYPALDLNDQMPMLPRSVPVMGMAALVPPLWKRLMAKPLARWTSPRDRDSLR